MALATQLTFSEAATWLTEFLQDCQGVGMRPIDLKMLQLIIDLLQDDRCLRKLRPGEPYFVFRGQDQLAPSTIKYWLSQIENTGTRLSAERIEEISTVVRAMEGWPERKLPD